MSIEVLLAEISDSSGAARKFYFPGWSTTLKDSDVNVGAVAGNRRFETLPGVTGGAAYLPVIPPGVLMAVEFRVEYIVGGTVGVGVCRSTETFSSAPGDTASSAVLRSDGFFRTNSVNTATSFGGFTSGDIITVFADTLTTPGSCRLWFRKNATFNSISNFNALATPDITFSTGTGDFHFYAGASASQTAIYVPSGFESELHTRELLGFDRWLYATSGTESQFTETLRFSTLPYTTRETDTPANTPFDPIILGEVEYSRDLGLWIWGDSRSATSIGFLDISDPTFKYDYLLSMVSRDLTVRFYTVGEGESYSTKTLLATLLVEKVECQPGGIKRFVLKDRSTALDVPILQTRYTDAIPNVNLRGKFRNTGYGIPQNVELVPLDLSNLIYEVGDVVRRNTGTLRDQGLSVSTFTDTAINIEEANAFRRTTAPAGVQTMSGLTYRKDAQIIGAAQGGEFTGWTGDNPDGWTVTETAPNNIVTQTIAGRARFLSNGGATVQISQNHGLASTERCGWEIHVVSRVSGRLFVVSGGVTLHTLQEVGFYKNVHVFPMPGADFSIRVPAGETADITIEYVRAWKMQRTDELPAAIRFLVQDRGGFASADIVSSDYDNLPNEFQSGTAQTTQLVADYFDSQINVSDAVTRLLNTFLCSWYISSDGKFRVARWRAPTTLDTPLFSFDSSNIVKDSLSIDFDEMAGLATDIKWVKNFRPLTDAEFAGAVSATDRALLREEFQQNTISQGKIALCYKSAVARFFESVFSSSGFPLVARNLAFLLRDLSAVPRYFFRFRAFASDPAMLSLKLGDFVQFTLNEDLSAFSSQRILRVKKISGKYGSKELEFVLWG